MLLSGVLITHALSDEAVSWFVEMRRVVDELVVFVDEGRAAPDLAGKLRQLDARVCRMRAGRFHELAFDAMMSACHGEWLLKIDYDEELSLEWQDRRWREILRDTDLTHFWLPRRWLTARDKYIHAEPWWPDRQLRLLRNDPAAITLPTQLHEHIRVNGAGGYARTLAIHHHDLRLTTRAAREAKAAAYERQRPGNGLGFYYLYEDYGRPELTVPSASAFEVARELMLMRRLTKDEAAQLRIEVDPPPRVVATGELLWLKVRLTNGIDVPICSGCPHPLNLAYHWLDALSGEPAIFEGARTAMLREVAGGECAEFEMFVSAPLAAGAYVLRVALVQEHVRWLDEAGSPTVQDFAVEVASLL